MRINKAIISYDFIKNEDEPYVYKKNSEIKIFVVVLEVDGIQIIENYEHMLSPLKA